MKKLLVMLILSTAVQAHFELGTYKGVDSADLECSVTLVSKSFRDGVRHPVNEIIEAVLNDSVAINFSLHHPVNVDADGFITVNSGILEGSVGIRGIDNMGADHLKVFISHEEGNEGPSSFIYSHSDWTNETAMSYECLNLQFVPEVK